MRQAKFLALKKNRGLTINSGVTDATLLTNSTFGGTTKAMRPLPCSYDLDIAARNYFYALESGVVEINPARSVRLRFSRTLVRQRRDMIGEVLAKHRRMVTM